jgi:hypothetical protein
VTSATKYRIGFALFYFGLFLLIIAGIDLVLQVIASLF